MLVSLAVLGLIAGLTIPGVVASATKAKVNNATREAIAIISNINRDMVMNDAYGQLNNLPVYSVQNPTDPLVAYLSSQINATKQCIKNDVAPPCDFSAGGGAIPTSTLMNHSARWVLPSGAKIGVFDIGAGVYPDKLVWALDAQPNNGVNDAFTLECSTSATNIATWSYPMMKPGQCLGGTWSSGIAKFAAVYN